MDREGATAHHLLEGPLVEYQACPPPHRSASPLACSRPGAPGSGEERHAEEAGGPFRVLVEFGSNGHDGSGPEGRHDVTQECREIIASDVDGENRFAVRDQSFHRLTGRDDHGDSISVLP